MGLINYIKKKYYDIPDWLLKLGGIAFYLLPADYRYGQDFKNTIKYLNETEHMSKQEIDKIIDTKFVDLVRHAYTHVGFYRELYDSCGVDISSIKGIKDIDKLPFIDKEIIKKHCEELISDDVKKDDLLYITTSGSTGNPVGFYQPQSMTMVEWAYTLHIWGRVGYKLDSSRLVLRGKKIRNQAERDWHYDPLRRELSCNIFNLSDSNIKKYIELIEKYKPDFIHGYMSAILLIAKYIKSNNIRLRHKFKAILATSENVLDSQKIFVEEVFNTRVFSFYGHSERLIIAGECEDSNCYHVEPTYGYCEIIDSSGNISEIGEIVATGFLNFAMPLIRYRTGDIGVIEKKPCACGRRFQLIKEVTGRWHQDMLINSDGSYVSLTAINIHSNEFDKIKRYKIIQEEKGVVLMLIMPQDSITENEVITIKKLLEEKTNSKIVFNIKIVNNIELPKNGKYRIVEQRII